jgi:hypothetical protein
MGDESRLLLLSLTHSCYLTLLLFRISSRLEGDGALTGVSDLCAPGTYDLYNEGTEKETSNPTANIELMRSNNGIHYRDPQKVDPSVDPVIRPIGGLRRYESLDYGERTV